MSLCAAMSEAISLASRKGMGVYVMRDVASTEGYCASLFCDHCPSAVVGVVLPDGTYHGF
jgi:hypothetical protein